ncbi:enoyl-CoA hydratase/isomerase family protein [Novosphingobium mangrovi (ex Hu et al. 2023)]|uniref:Enoyl-CoA hydratase-related protein n=1 Tax=Novosphingobium mangrovi (ex Hu et al. 2023) TaxID=2930094 RepID=A0ABT0AGQ6_9SPHN|nr:enoyl-CoA hydratase-related protein [Novosphingobium mangrovi (ex Hu et al. 2023)]MCJ1962345.1 enoyl-CoA hydratase-related protein [Novosphingobium mangrovi (ex Hu et al. 2023)]
MSPLPSFETLILERRERLLVLTLNRPEALNAVNLTLHDELPEALVFIASDPGSDVVLLTGAGRAFSAGGDLDHMERNAREPHLFDHEARQAKRIIEALLTLEKPLVVRMNGHAVGLGATIALMGDIIVAADGAKIGDPHVGIGLVAGDGGALIWAARIGLTRAKEFLLTGELVPATEAERIGLINRCVPADELDAVVEDYCRKLTGGAPQALRWTKVLTNLELRRVGAALLDAGIAYEALSVRTADHREGLTALRERRAPRFKGE